jgi:hypothetical protein
VKQVQQNTLSSYFNDLVFDEANHRYKAGSKDLISVTTFLKRYVKPFDSFAISHQVAKSKQKAGINVDADYIRRYWNLSGAVSREIGNKLHHYASALPNLDAPQDKLEEAVNNFYTDHIKDKERVLATELITYYGGLAGTLDLITQDDKGLIIRDWKTSADIEKSYSKMLTPFDNFKDSQLNQYSLQLLCYKYIIENATKQKVHKLEIVKIAESGYEVYQINKEIEEVFDNLLKLKNDGE